jgi:hypothetical protein
MEPLEIEVLWHSNSTKPLSDAGVDFDYDELETKTMTFYIISAIIPYDWDDQHKGLCKILSNDDYWITPYSYETVKSMIENKNQIK